MSDDNKSAPGVNDESKKETKQPREAGDLESGRPPEPPVEAGEGDFVALEQQIEKMRADEETEGNLFVAGIGASAGGLEALTELLRYAPAQGAYIIVQHLAPEHESILAQLLARNSRFSVAQASDGMVLEAGRVYVIPPNSDLAVMHGVLRVLTPPSLYGPRLPVDFLFRSLAEDAGHRAMGIVLSGTGTDGTLGLKAIKEAGGFTFVQDPATARYDGMPRSALQSGSADFCFPVKQFAEEIERIIETPQRFYRPGPAAPSTQVQDALGRLFVLIRSEFGNDLSNYKPTTVDRRLNRRMTMAKLERLDDYVKYVQSNRDELKALYKDMLITVTSFFRDPDAFAALKSTVFPQILEHKEPNQPIRVWVPACATGEEAYSIAISLLEFCAEKVQDERIQIFATDIDEDCIQYARHSIYPPNIAIDVSPERLNRFFIRKDNEYQVSRRVRDLLVFSRQNILKDAPFSRMDLISCRNLLIYLQPPAQKRALRVIHYALNPSGYLLLGSSETVGDAPDLFASVDRKNKIYVRRQVAVPAGLEMTFVPTPLDQVRAAPAARPALHVNGLADRKVLELYGPPGVVINEDLEILQFRGHTGPYLDPAPGIPSFNLLRVARFEFHVELKRAIQEAISQQQRTTTEVTYSFEGQPVTVKIDVVPFTDPDLKTRWLLVLFHKLPPVQEILLPTEAEAGEAGLPFAKRIQDLERELTMTKDYLQTITEEKESALEELKSANEELQSSNEELQSTNEELETSKEELQSTNEELTTVNEELHNRMFELSQANDDLHNILSGIDNAVVITGMDLKIRRFTAAAEKLFNLLPGDIGRSIAFLDAALPGIGLESKVSSVIQSLSTIEEEVFGANRHWFALRISPYKTLDHTIRGALVTLADIDIRKRSEEMMRDVATYASRFLAPISHPLLIVDGKLRIVWANTASLTALQLSPDETVGAILPTIGTRQFANPGLLDRIKDVLKDAKVFRDYEMHILFPEGEKTVRVGGSQIPASPETPLALISIESFDKGLREDSNDKKAAR
jgi:two-component system CheB/CheR fusion protein